MEPDKANIKPCELGYIDRSFVKGKRPVVVDLLVTYQGLFDQEIFDKTVQYALSEANMLGGNRVKSYITYGNRIKCSSRVNETSSYRQTKDLFESLSCNDEENEVFAMRMTKNIKLKTSQIGISWDHSLCDVGGISLVLQRIEAAYFNESVALLLPKLHHDRSIQDSVRFQNAANFDSLAKASSTNYPIIGKFEDVTEIQFVYTKNLLDLLKEKSLARTRHQALFTDIILLLSAIGHTVNTASISVSARGKKFNIPCEHFGNTTLVVAVPIQCHFNDCIDCSKAVTASIHKAITEEIGVPQLTKPADVHFTSWWHPLQILTSFDTPLNHISRLSYDIGPQTRESAKKLTAITGKPNVNILPSSSCDRDSLKVSIRLPSRNMANKLEALFCQRQVVTSCISQERKASEHEKPSINCDCCITRNKTVSTSIDSVINSDYKRDALTLLNEIPIGHTSFSWYRGNPSAQIPASHTPYSWINASSELNPPTAMFTSIKEYACGFIFLHGLGGMTTTWVSSFKSLMMMIGDEIKMVFPTAPVRVVKATQTKMASWFDLQSYPLTEAELHCTEEPKGLNQSIAQICEIINDLHQAFNIPYGKIVLGGFSQGGALALETVLRFPHQLAGVVSISGWCSYFTKLDGIHQNSYPSSFNKTPVLFTYGDEDPIIPNRLSLQSIEKIKSSVVIQDQDKIFIIQTKRKRHMPINEEVKSVTDFIKCHIIK